MFLATAGLGVGVGGRGRQRVRCPCSFSPGRVAVWPPFRPWFSSPPLFCARSPVPLLSSVPGYPLSSARPPHTLSSPPAFSSSVAPSVSAFHHIPLVCYSLSARALHTLLSRHGARFLYGLVSEPLVPRKPARAPCRCRRCSHPRRAALASYTLPRCCPLLPRCGVACAVHRRPRLPRLACRLLGLSTTAAFH